MNEELSKFDREHVWHPYTSLESPLPTYDVSSASGCELILSDGKHLVDGVSSWWSCIHGYNVPEINRAAEVQLSKMSHVMFAGIRHEPAAELAKMLLEMAPKGLDSVFFADSGSVAVEVALKMALQYFSSTHPGKKKFAALRGGYHGDTFAAMGVTDPEGSMHSVYRGFIAENFFVNRPACRFGDPWDPGCADDLEKLFEKEHESIAALILEPIVQGAGGMYFYHPEYLRRARALCDRFGVLLIADEIATGFGRTGKMFACEWGGICPDIMTVGKGLTAGYLTMSAVLASEKVKIGICSQPPGALMHGPTFMANPLAASIAVASMKKLHSSGWQENVRRIEKSLKKNLLPLSARDCVKSARVLGSIGVIELYHKAKQAELQKRFVELGAWIRPFDSIIYLMLPYVISDEQVEFLCRCIETVLAEGHAD